MRKTDEKMLMGLFVLSIFWCSTGFGSTYYVASDGDDTHPGTLERPWRTIRKANLTLQPGDTVWVREGVYPEDINPVHSGTRDAEIVYKNYADEKVVLRGHNQGGDEAVVAVGWPGSAADWEPKSHVVVEGFTIDPRAARYGVAVSGKESRNNVLRGCVLVNRVEGERDGIVIHQAKNSLIENNTVDGWRLGVITTGTPERTVIRNNRILNSYGSGIDIQTSHGVNQAMLVEGNLISGSRTEDGIQFEPDYDLDFDAGTKRGVIIRGNVISDNAENGIDLKGAADVVIEKNIIWGNRGDDNGEGNLGGGTGGIMKGDIAHTQAHDILIRRNVIYDNLGGVSIHNHGWVVIHNTIVGNNRSHSGPDCSADRVEGAPTGYLRRLPGLVGVMLVEPTVDDFRGCVVKNNIIGGHHQGEVAVRTTADLNETEIDGNLYFNRNGVFLADVRSPWDWERVGFEGWGLRFHGLVGPAGKEAHSFATADPGLGLSTDAPVGAGPFDFTLRSDSPAVDKGLFLTQTRSAGSGTALPVGYAGFFTDGYGIVDGDEIQIASSGERARIVSIDDDTNTLTLNRALSWLAGDGVALPYADRAPDVGAFEYGL